MMKKEIITTPNAPQAKGPYSQGLMAGDFLFVSAQGPFDPKTGKIVGPDIGSQTRRTLENVKAIVEASGFKLEDVVKVSIYLSKSDDFQKMNEIYQTFFTGNPPARTTLEARVPIPNVLVAADAIAHR
jgi:2-iminobutanoate/2-iminopropanoate deaminase